ncbi:MAG: lysine--tRNA ligase [Candidatus Omnitrophica bacterium]|nr:lysine--tRNA ligase [Candidatus Omnitrophota bacterium]
MDNITLLPDSNDIVKLRLEKLSAIKGCGVEPYGHAFAISVTLDELQKNFAEGKKVSIAGRILALRWHGKSVFGKLSDAKGSIQFYIRKESVGESAFQNLERWVDIGDIIGVEGDTFKTRTGEATVHVSKYELLSKSLRPLPEKWHGLKDDEIRYRRRYLDIIVSDEAKKTFILRSRVIAKIREFLNNEGFLEVETPILQPLAGGALARPFVTHHNALGIDLYLRIAPELYLKRMLVGGWDRVYELSRNFRNEGISTRHNPEFTMLEVYQAFTDYSGMMDLTEKMICHLAETLLGGMKLEYNGKTIDLSPPWQRITFNDALCRFAGVKENSLNDFEELKKCAIQKGLEPGKGESKAGILDELLKKAVSPQLDRPTFIYDYPVELSPLARRKSGDGNLVERFQPFICGLEVGNAFSELNDPLEQRERFLQQMNERQRGDEEAHRLDEDFLRALEYGMPPAGGLGIGIDRLVMLFSNNTSIREVILFPVLKPEPPRQPEII